MACPAITTGDSFLATTLGHIDCQAQTLGSFGFTALADPTSPTSLALTSLLTVFIALFGIRLLLGYPASGRDTIGDVIKIGIVLTLATSWPAWRVIGYDLVINGPGEIARAIGMGTGLQGGAGDLTERLQQADNALSALGGLGSGRLGVAQGDWFQLGFARIMFLAGTLAPLALIRLTAGILLAIAPLMAGLLLFGITRSIFTGWARGLVMTFLASLLLTLLLGAQLAVIEPWLTDALTKRAADQQILDAPAEILAVTLAFAVACLGSLAIAARIAFFSAAESRTELHRQHRPEPGSVGGQTMVLTGGAASDAPSRATAVALSVSENLRREARIETARLPDASRMTAESGSRAGGRSELPEALGGSYRRAARRVSASGSRRDQGQ